MISALALALLASGSPSVTTLPNGARLALDPMPEAASLSVQLWAAGPPESPEEHGLRHLLEHLVSAKGPLERHGMFLDASTSREAIILRVDAPPVFLPQVLEGLTEVVRGAAWTASDLAREVRAIRNERALLSTPSLHAFAMTRRVMDAGESFGSLSVMERATPASMSALRSATFASDRVVLSLAGRIPSGAEERARSWLARLSAAPARTAGSGVGNWDPLPAVEGSAVGVPLPPAGERAALALLAAGMAVEAAFDDVYLVFAWSGRPGVATLSARRPDLQGRLARVGDADLALGMLRVRSDLARRLADPGERAGFRAAMLTSRREMRLQTVQDLAQSLTLPEIQAGLQAWRRGEALEGLR